MSEKAVPEGKYADIGGGLRVHYHDAGKGPVVLFLHGSGPGASGWSNFRRNYPFLVEHGYRTLVPDTLGFGYSSKPDDVDYGLDFLVDALRRFLATVGVEKCAVVGNSHGGAMSIRLATRFPELVSKLVLMAPGGLEERETYMKMEGIRAMMKAFLGPEGITDASMRTVFGHQLFDPSLVTDDIIRERSEIAVLQPKRVLTSLHVPHLAPELAQIQCPVLGFWGMDDKFCPVSGATTIARSCKRARVVLLSQCGHWVMVEHRDYFNRETLDFLREESLRGGVDDRVIEGLGDELYAALRERRTVPPITSRHEGVTIEDAYRISQRLLARRLRDGERVIGKKIGVTSKPVQRMLDVHQPDFGWLTDRMQYAAGGEMPIGRELIQPRAEGELAFVLARDLRGPGVTPADVLAATAHVSVCFEIVDSRIDDWKIRIQDTIADNASSGLFLLGDDRVDPRKVDFYTCGMVVEKNGEIISTGAGAAALGSPLVCVAWLANTMGAFGIPLEAGEIILSGSLVPLEKVVPGDRMKVTVGGIGAADVTFV